jgi:adenine-specific DNA methylase
MDGKRRDALLLAADITEEGMKVFRAPTDEEVYAATQAEAVLSKEEPFGFLPARPHEEIPSGNTRTIQSVNYGDKTYGDLCEARQTLGLVRLARAINEASAVCIAAGLSPGYVKALEGYATAAMMRKIRRSTRGARLQITGGTQVGDIFTNQSAVTASYDWFESGLSDGPGSLASLSEQTVTALRNIRSRATATPAKIARGTAVGLRFGDQSVDAVVTDPPYDDMIDYSDSTDLFYVWAKRAMMTADPAFSMTMHASQVQEKDDEIIIKRGGGPAKDHRDKDHFASMIERAYAEMARVVSDDGVVTIVFGHGDPEVWHRMLSALSKAKLVLTGSWPAKTEAGGGGAGSANIVTTLTMACRPAPPGRGEGRVAQVESEIKAQIKTRMKLWAKSDLAITDMLMASAGPAMEVAGQYQRITNSVAEEVELDRFLVTARRAVREASAIPVDNLKLEDFDPRTLFALWWVRLYQRQLTPKSELRWELMAADLQQNEVKSLIRQEAKGCRFVLSSQITPVITQDAAIIDVVLAMAAAWPDGIDEVGRVLALAGKAEPDEQLWAAIAFLEGQLPHPDPDSAAWAGLNRNRASIQQSAVGQLASGDVTWTRRRRPRLTEQTDSQDSLF